MKTDPLIKATHLRMLEVLNMTPEEFNAQMLGDWNNEQ